MNLVLLTASTSCRLREIFLAAVSSGSLIKDLNLHADYCKAALSPCLLFKTL